MSFLRNARIYLQEGKSVHAGPRMSRLLLYELLFSMSHSLLTAGMGYECRRAPRGRSAS